MRRISAAKLSLVARAALALAMTAGGAAAQSIPCGEVYEVRPGDTLREIALSAYDSGNYQVIFDANQDILRTPSLLLVGQRLFIPCVDGSGPATRQEAEALLVQSQQLQAPELTAEQRALPIPEPTVSGGPLGSPGPLALPTIPQPEPEPEPEVVVTGSLDEDDADREANPAPTEDVAEAGTAPAAGGGSAGGGLLDRLSTGAPVAQGPGEAIGQAGVGAVSDEREAADVLASAPTADPLPAAGQPVPSPGAGPASATAAGPIAQPLPSPQGQPLPTPGAADTSQPQPAQPVQTASGGGQPIQPPPGTGPALQPVETAGTGSAQPIQPTQTASSASQPIPTAPSAGQPVPTAPSAGQPVPTAPSAGQPVPTAPSASSPSETGIGALAALAQGTGSPRPSQGAGTPAVVPGLGQPIAGGSAADTQTIAAAPAAEPPQPAETGTAAAQPLQPAQTGTGGGGAQPLQPTQTGGASLVPGLGQPLPETAGAPAETGSGAAQPLQPTQTGSTSSPVPGLGQPLPGTASAPAETASSAAQPIPGPAVATGSANAGALQPAQTGTASSPSRVTVQATSGAADDPLARLVSEGETPAPARSDDAGGIPQPIQGAGGTNGPSLAPPALPADPGPTLALATPLAPAAPDRPDNGTSNSNGNATRSAAATDVLDPLASQSASLPRIRLLTGDYPPYTGADLPQQGMLSEVVRRALGLGAPERELRVTFIDDWEPHLTVLLPEGAFDLGFPWFKPDCGALDRLSAEMRVRCTEYLWSQPLHELVIGYFVRAGDPASGASSYDALAGRTICRPRGYYTFDLEQKGLVEPTIRMIRPETPADCIAALIEGRADLTVLAVSVAETEMAELGVAGQVDEIPALADILTLHVLGPRSNPFARTYLTLLNRGLRQMRDSGEWFDVVARHLASPASR
ncbi:MAG: LysM peptidoglycan-binding domain-containing protein [Paracoccaceae bacterium]